MRILTLAVTSLIVASLPAYGQFKVHTDKGDVTIGPGGIKVSQPGEANVNIGPGGISVKKPGKNVQIGPGGISVDKPGKNVQIGPGGVNVNRNNVTNRGYTRQVITGTSTQGQAVLPITTRVDIIERQIYGKTFTNLPLLKRVEKLETENLGAVKKDVLSRRVDRLEKELGINTRPNTVTSISQSNVNTGNSSSSVNVSSGGGQSSIVLSQSNSTRVVNMNGGSLVLNGDRCRITVRGWAKSLVVNGDQNNLKLDKVVGVTVNGDSNSVTWRDSFKPVITDNGRSNHIAKI